VVKTYGKELAKLQVHFGFLNNQRLDTEAVLKLADLPSMEVLRATLLGVLQAPAGKLVRLLNTPASQLAQVLKARQDKMGEAPAPAA
jgi:large subunit ribosomal protein L10